MIRKIVKINEEKCNGCGLCVNACVEGAIELVNGKAKLVSEEYCDGLGNCLPVCPTGAIEIIEAEAKPFNEKAVEERLNQKKQREQFSCMCPGSQERVIERSSKLEAQEEKNQRVQESKEELSELVNWPVQLNLVNPYAKFFDNAHILIAADCVAYAYASFHRDFMKGKVTIIGCPKLDNIEYYYEKILEIIQSHNIKSITVVKMEVPCCNGIASIVKKAMLQAQKILPYQEVTITTDGGIKE
ncbi:4Fe-4S ferredoxin iron-sulfur binding domain protein [Caldicellulosiruptor hydrothermalis 108]|uniref:4Fe-4S ferredoxin iron-sulfur binding domain protein n=1 Tax=Caldicellulosiruptor hydrothermalis (strain DSM 18901 / VKM B-2411 / 108) TaxID=632292 RepID=E4QBR0_CALH1|nr:4Fe-4S binding protein [Caldicellulosiruptor hydrothermalis]ADQ07276.1 4Fe-4S ferredoxin iron-sulfur binding domain protein [Caldicellulosiruptor hydrothermalis 108]